MMTEKQRIRYDELEYALRQLGQDVYDIHWKDLDKKEKDELMNKFHDCLNRMRTALVSEDDRDAA